MNASHLFPVSHFESGFTTCPSVHLAKVSHVALGDEPLGVHKVTASTSHKLVTPPVPDGTPDKNLPPPSKAWEAVYPKGSVNPAGKIIGGFGFYAHGPKDFAAKLSGDATEAVMSYRMMLEHEWEWVKGGKLPGVFGGVGDSSYACTGGRQHDRATCFNLRLMWRAHSVGELYAYVPQTAGNATHLLAVPPSSMQNTDYGFSVGRGAYKFATGRWISVAIRVKLNTVHETNGEIQLWIDGVSVMHATGLTLRDTDKGKIQGMHFQTFFGGHTEDWASPKDQRAWFADVSGAIIA